MSGSGTFQDYDHVRPKAARAMSTVITSTTDCRADHDRGNRDRASRPRGHAGDDRDQPGTFAVPVEVRCGNHREEKRGQEGRGRGDAGSGQPGDQIADEAGGDHDGARRDERDRDGIEKFSLRQPVVLERHAAVKEGYDRQATAEHEAALRKRKTRGSAAGARRCQPLEASLLA